MKKGIFAVLGCINIFAFGNGFCCAQNLNPTEEQYSAGNALLDTLAPLYKSDLSPAGLKKNFGIELMYTAGGEYVDNGTPHHSRRLASKHSFDSTNIKRYDIEWGGKSRIVFWMDIDDSKACISEHEIQKRFGSSAKFGRSTMRHFAPGQIPPKGLRATMDSWSISSETGAEFSFQFDYVCSSQIMVSADTLPDNWYQADSDNLKIYFDAIRPGMPVEGAVDEIRKMGFECPDTNSGYFYCKKPNDDDTFSTISISHSGENVGLVYVSLREKIRLVPQ